MTKELKPARTEPDEDSKESLTIDFLRRDLEDQHRSESTVNLYLSIARRFEKFAGELKNDPVDFDEDILPRARLLELAEAWAEEEIPDATPATTRSYRAGLVAYLSVIDPTIEASELDLGLGERRRIESGRWAGRRRPSDPLEDRQVNAIRRKLAKLPERQTWKRTMFELGLSGLTWEEITTIKGHEFSPYGDEARITFIDRTIPIHDGVAVQWLWSLDSKSYPAGANGKGVSPRTAKTALGKIVAQSRGAEFGDRQGLRTLHNTGITRTIRRGVDLTEVARIFQRAKIPPEWERLVPARAALGRTENIEAVTVAGDTASADRGRVLLGMDNKDFNEKVLHVQPEETLE